MLDNCVSSPLVSLGAMTGDSRCGQPGFSSKSLSDTRSVAGGIYILGTSEIKNKTLVIWANRKPH